MEKKSVNGGFLRKSLSVFLSIALVVSFLPTFSSAKVAQAEETKGVEEGQLKSEEEILESVDGTPVSSEEITERAINGGVYSLFDRSDVNYSVKDSDFGIIGKRKLKATQLPSSVDLRNFNGQNRVTSVKNQANTGTCWAWAANAVSETNIATSTGQKASTSYSPFQTAYFAYNALSTDESELQGTEVSQKGEGVVWASDDIKKEYALNTGGTTFQASSQLIQGVGPTSATSIPFPNSSLTDGTMTSTLSSEQRRQSVARLSKWSLLGSLATTKYTYDDNGNITSYIYDSTNKTVLNRIKTELSEGKAVEISYWAGQSYWWQPSLSTYYNSKNYCQYTTDPGIHLTANHAVTVVGYDDSFSKTNFNSDYQPPEDGAFIVKNSWGSNWGKAGYFYLSYWDQTIMDATVYEYDTTNYDGNDIDASKEIVDQYDYTSAEDVLEVGAQATSEVAQWYSNIYTASENQKLHSIGTYYCSEGKTLNYKVYKLKDDATNPYDVAGSLDSPDAEGTYTNDYKGFATIKLDKPVNLKKGEKYAIMFSQINEDGYYCAPQSMNLEESASGKTKYWEVNAVVNPGESFYLTEGSSTWKTISDTKIWSEAYETNLVFDNYCVKGYATVQPYSVTFYDGDTVYETQMASEGDSITKPTDPTKEGYTFDGWYKDAEFTEPFEFTETVTGNVELYAKFSPNTYDVNFYDGVSLTSTQKVEYNSCAKEPAPVPTKEGYTFDGWYTLDGTTSGDWGSKFDFSETQITGTINLYAKWTKVETVVCTVTFNTDGGSAVAVETVNSGETVAKPATDPTKVGYTFAGWYTDSTYESEFDFNTLITEDITLYAKWDADSYTATFNANGGNVSPETQSFTIETGLATLPTPTKEGYTFVGWFVGEKQYTAIEKGTVGDLTLTAKWEVSIYTVTFNANGGNVTPETQSFTIETGLATLPTPTKEGYTFAGWFVGEKQYTAIEKGTVGDLTLIAKWTQNASDDRLLQDGHTYIIYSHASGKTLGVTGGFKFNYAGISQMSLINSAAQQWKVKYDSDDYVTFINVNSGKALDLSGGWAFNGARIQQYSVVNTNSQKWKVEKVGDQYVIRSKVNTSYVLNLLGGWSYDLTPIYLKKADNSNAQKWTFFDLTAKQDEVASALTTNSTTIKEGVYEITPANSSKNALSITKSSKKSWFSWLPWFSSEDSGNVQVATKNNSNEQRWEVSFDNQGYAHIKCVSSGKFLNVDGDSKLSGTNVNQDSNKKSDGQKWVFIKNSNGTYKVVSALFPTLVLDVNGNGTASGTNVQVYNDNGSQAQQWEFAVK